MIQKSLKIAVAPDIAAGLEWARVQFVNLWKCH
jgi:hypothetical protein